ncbi:E1-E2 ATPase [Atopobium sp. BS2]|uniref:HAD-IC family P-type ATPase n=1 Tax=Atopobium sp. BS2 TaxID=936550 RepID=UPI00044BF23D|nr:HAD-IC family P-type ATPase [Atopobium sp. BS2]EWC92868.1 E1-E2 ATPase [Atopobium sp. BS2]
MSLQDTAGKSSKRCEEAYEGLTSKEVAERVSAGKVNTNTDVKTKSIAQIIAEHSFTLFNIVNVLMALLVVVTGQYRNALFMSVVLANLVIGIVQEIRAKRMVDRLSLMTAQSVCVIRDGKDTFIKPDELVIDDLVRLKTGDQIPADSILVSEHVSVDESLLTGEAEPVQKTTGDELLSGSFVERGSLVGRVCRVGQEGYAARINAEAKFVKEINSEILTTIKSIIRAGSIALIPLGIGLFVRTYFIGNADLNEALLSMIAAVIGMIPQGLVLLTSSVLAIATIRLGQKNVLVQQQYCIETLARVDTLCLDKTGTITTGNMEVARILDASFTPITEAAGALQAAVNVVGANKDDANDTATAILAYASKQGIQSERPSRVVAFSSKRKYSGCVTEDGQAFVIGAAQFVLGPEAADVIASSDAFASIERVLVACTVDGFDQNDTFQGTPQLLGYVVLRDQIRETAPQTIAYFLEQGVDLRVISGDDPRTVSAIAERAGVPHADGWVDATMLHTEADIAAAVEKYHVFGRVTPEQKRELVIALQNHGHTVAMTGDGVNDILALRQSDCSISVASGSAAARNVAEIVLADNDFAHMPEVVAEGRRSINNLQRSAALILVKTVYTAALALYCIIAPPYPFIPVQMSLLSFATVGLPSFVLALEPNHDRVKGNFLVNILRKSLPASIAVTITLALLMTAGHLFKLNLSQVSTMALITTATVGFALLRRISLPLTKLRVALLVVCIAIVVGGCTVAQDFFRIAPLTPRILPYLSICLVISVIIFNRISERYIHNYTKDRFFDLVVRLMGGKSTYSSSADIND